jgi:hypothetical protein
MQITPDPALTNGTTDATPTPQPTPAPSSDTTQSGMPGVPTSTPAQATVTQPQAAALAPKSAPIAAPTPDPIIAAASTGKGATGILRGILFGALRGAQSHIASTSQPAQPSGVIPAVGQGIKKVAQGVGREASTFLKAQPAYQARSAQQQDMQLKANTATLLAHKYALENQKSEMEIAEHTEDRAAKLQADNDAANAASQAFIDMAKREGITADFTHGPGHDNLGASHAADVAQGNAVHVQNGETGKDAGVVILPVNQMQRTPLTQDFKTPSTFEIDPKTGDVKVTGYQTLPAGSSTVGDAHSAYKDFIQRTADAQKQWTDGQKRRLDAANVADKTAETGARKTSDQVAAESKAEIGQKNAEAGKANADAVATRNAGNADVMNNTAQQLVEGNLDPSQLNRRGKNYEATLAAADAYSMQKYGKHFDIAQASNDYKFASNVQTQNTLKYLNSLTGADNKSGNLAQLVTQSNGINRTDFPALNDVQAWAKLQTGNPAIAAYHATVTEVADQLAKILQGGNGGGTSDAKMKQANELFAQGFSKEQVIAIASDLRGLLANRKGELIGNNPYLQRQYSAAPSGSAAGGSSNNFGATPRGTN